jgi:hypothetical protein
MPKHYGLHGFTEALTKEVASRFRARFAAAIRLEWALVPTAPGATRVRTRFAVTIWLFALCSVASAQSTAPQNASNAPDAKEAKTTSTITGRVTVDGVGLAAVREAYQVCG